MKLTKSIFLCASLLSASTLISWSDTTSAEPSVKDTPKIIAKKDSAESLTDELITGMNKLADTIGSATDKGTAEAAAKKIAALGDDFSAIAGRMDKLDTPSEEEKKALDIKMTKASEEMKKKMQGSMTTLMQNPEIAEILAPAMMEFGQRMNKHNKVFERFGKNQGKNKKK